MEQMQEVREEITVTETPVEVLNTPYEGLAEEAATPVTEEGAPNGTPAEEVDPQAVDYAAMAGRDLKEIRRLSPMMEGLSHLSQLPNAGRYAALRDAGLSVEEALWAACHCVIARAGYDNRSHLRSAVPLGATTDASAMSPAEMAAAKELFGDMTEGEIQRLWARCK